LDPLIHLITSTPKNEVAGSSETSEHFHSSIQSDTQKPTQQNFTTVETLNFRSCRSFEPLTLMIYGSSK